MADPDDDPIRVRRAQVARWTRLANRAGYVLLLGAIVVFFAALLTGSSGWRDLPDVMTAIASGALPGLCHTIDWRDAP